MSNYTVKSPTVGDLRAIRKSSKDGDDDIEFMIAERCILEDGKPIGSDKLNVMDLGTFEKLMSQINVKKS